MTLLDSLFVCEYISSNFKNVVEFNKDIICFQIKIYHVIYMERWEHGTEGIGLDLNPRWRLQLMSYSWIIV